MGIINSFFFLFYSYRLPFLAQVQKDSKIQIHSRSQRNSISWGRLFLCEMSLGHQWNKNQNTTMISKNKTIPKV